MKRPLALTGIIMVCCIGLVLLLYLGNTQHRNLHFASFHRNFSKDFIRPTDTLDIKFNSYYVAGVTDHHIYLGNYSAPGHLLVTDRNMSDTIHLRLQIPVHINHCTLQVDSPYFHLINGQHPFIYTGVLSNRSAVLNVGNIYFSSALSISRNSFGLLAVPSGTRKMTIQKKYNDNPSPKLFPDLLQKQIDGIFCTEGMFHYNKRKAELLYIYSYRNEYFAMDTNLNLLYRANTIDTVTRAKISLGKNHDKNSLTMLGDRVIVNKKSAVNGNLLFIHSNLLARNDNLVTFQEQTVVDIYDLSDQTYQASFYIPPYRDVKVKSFHLIGNNQLICLYDHHLVAYSFDN